MSSASESVDPNSLAKGTLYCNDMRAQITHIKLSASQPRPRNFCSATPTSKLRPRNFDLEITTSTLRLRHFDLVTSTPTLRMRNFDLETSIWKLSSYLRNQGTQAIYTKSFTSRTKGHMFHPLRCNFKIRSQLCSRVLCSGAWHRRTVA